MSQMGHSLPMAFGAGVTSGPKRSQARCRQGDKLKRLLARARRQVRMSFLPCGRCSRRRREGRGHDDSLPGAPVRRGQGRCRHVSRAHRQSHRCSLSRAVVGQFPADVLLRFRRARDTSAVPRKPTLAYIAASVEKCHQQTSLVRWRQLGVSASLDSAAIGKRHT